MIDALARLEAIRRMIVAAPPTDPEQWASKLRTWKSMAFNELASAPRLESMALLLAQMVRLRLSGDTARLAPLCERFDRLRERHRA